ncbi:helix-turn-helix domain-containing protein [Cellvibrio sp. OA-2007]|uniref:helix-turn-helix domain-containing protein n=1 Tax=Cellvibrio sp. OA-2007 TaxID=529823 RepID=UPI0007812CE2|nr:helix-turn-helix transcriptional regulator [Cellvibrio sp. OA-2007]
MDSFAQEMKISSTKIRHLRTQLGWSQEQLALASGLSLRTIQRVEAEGKASRETRVCLAATLSVELAELFDESNSDAEMLPVPSVFRYKLALAVAGLGLVPILLNIAGFIASNVLLSALHMMVIALSLYGSFGWYFTGQPRPASRGKRYVQVTFIAGAMFFAFAFFGQDNSSPAAIGVAAQITALALGVYFLLDYWLSRRTVKVE